MITLLNNGRVVQSQRLSEDKEKQQAQRPELLQGVSHSNPQVTVNWSFVGRSRHNCYEKVLSVCRRHFCRGS